MSANDVLSYAHRDAATLLGTLVESRDRVNSGGVDWNADIYRFFIDALCDVVHMVNPDLSVDDARVENERKRIPAIPSVVGGPVTFAPNGPTAEEIADALFRRMQRENMVHRDAIATAVPMAEPDESIPEPGIVAIPDSEKSSENH